MEDKERIEEQIGKLENVHRHDKDILLFLQLLNSVGKYIKKRKVNAHPDAIKLLNSVYDSLENVLSSPNISSDEKRQKLLDQVGAFKKLKEQIAQKKSESDIRNAFHNAVNPRAIRTTPLAIPTTHGHPDMNLCHIPPSLHG